MIIAYILVSGTKDFTSREKMKSFYGFVYQVAYQIYEIKKLTLDTKFAKVYISKEKLF